MLVTKGWSPRWKIIRLRSESEQTKLIESPWVDPSSIALLVRRSAHSPSVCFQHFVFIAYGQTLTCHLLMWDVRRVGCARGESHRTNTAKYFENVFEEYAMRKQSRSIHIIDNLDQHCNIIVFQANVLRRLSLLALSFLWFTPYRPPSFGSTSSWMQ